MKDFRMIDISFSFRHNGKTDSTVYDRDVLLDVNSNQSFYACLSSAILEKRKIGNIRTIIDELYIPQEMWNAGIWKRYLLLKGTALFKKDNSEELECADVEFILQIGENPAPLSDRHIKHIPEKNAMKVSNINVDIVCNSIQLTVLE